MAMVGGSAETTSGCAPRVKHSSMQQWVASWSGGWPESEFSDSF